MKNFHVFSLAIIFVMPLFLGSGCTMLKDLLGISDLQDPDGIPAPDEDPALPTDFVDGPLGDREGGWGKERLDLKLPVIYFSYDKFSIGAREKQILEQIAAYMQKNPGFGLRIDGHCDERGSDEYNRTLGERRALAVHDYLLTIGIPSDRLKTQSFGEERLSVEGHNESAHSKNRRAELVLMEM